MDTPTPDAVRFAVARDQSRSGLGYAAIVSDGRRELGTLFFTSSESATAFESMVANAGAVKGLVAALTEIMGWIDDYIPGFTQDERWNEPEARARAALAAAREGGG